MWAGGALEGGLQGQGQGQKLQEPSLWTWLCADLLRRGGQGTGGGGREQGQAGWWRNHGAVLAQRGQVLGEGRDLREVRIAVIWWRDPRKELGYPQAGHLYVKGKLEGRRLSPGQGRGVGG